MQAQCISIQAGCDVERGLVLQVWAVSHTGRGVTCQVTAVSCVAAVTVQCIAGGQEEFADRNRSPSYGALGG